MPAARTPAGARQSAIGEATSQNGSAITSCSATGCPILSGGPPGRRGCCTRQTIWQGRRNRKTLAAAIRTDLRTVRVVRAALPDPHAADTLGVVERFGKYVLGTEGWRAGIVVIRKLRAPSNRDRARARTS